jgi:AraC-like DNA-binding protein
VKTVCFSTDKDQAKIVTPALRIIGEKCKLYADLHGKQHPQSHLTMTKFSNPFDEAPFLQKARARVLEHLDDETFGVAELADTLFLCRAQLFRKVKALTGRNVAAFIHQVRIEEARRLLATTDLTVAEIAWRTGFSDPSYLRRVFLRETGETLARYRRLVRVGKFSLGV